MPETIAPAEAEQISTTPDVVASTGVLDHTAANTANVTPGSHEITVNVNVAGNPTQPQGQPETTPIYVTATEPSLTRQVIAATGKNALAAAKWTGRRAKEAAIWTGERTVETLKRAKELMSTPTAKTALAELVNLGLGILTEPYKDSHGNVHTNQFVDDYAGRFKKSPKETMLGVAKKVAPAFGRYAVKKGPAVVDGVKSDLRRGNG